MINWLIEVATEFDAFNPEDFVYGVWHSPVVICDLYIGRQLLDRLLVVLMK